MFDAAFVDGLVLAAMVLDDRAGVARAGFAPGLADAFERRRAELDSLPRPVRHREVRALVDAMTAVPPELEAPPRVKAILAANRDRATARAWSEGAPPVRRRFRVPRGLRVTLRRLAWAELSNDGLGSKHGADVALTAASARSGAIERELSLVEEAPWRG